MPGQPLLDELMANAWRPVVDEKYGGWRYRWAEGVTRRANSVLALETNERIEHLVDYAEAFYGQRRAPTRIQVTAASAPQHLAVHLRERGYESTARTRVEQATASEVAHRTGPTPEVQITDAPTDAWFQTYWSVEATRGRSDRDMAVCRDVLLAPNRPMAFASLLHGGEAVGVGQLVVEGSWAGVQCMATDPAHRRRGVAQAVLSGLAEEATRRKVDKMYLAVMADNVAATALYARAGFTTVHEYCYFNNRPNS